MELLRGDCFMSRRQHKQWVPDREASKQQSGIFAVLRGVFKDCIKLGNGLKSGRGFGVLFYDSGIAGKQAN